MVFLYSEITLGMVVCLLCISMPLDFTVRRDSNRDVVLPLCILVLPLACVNTALQHEGR